MESNTTSRRGFVGTMGMTFAAATAGATTQTASAQSAASNGTGGNQLQKQNPISEYPNPPFPDQRQPWPGLQSKMTPRPNSGETTYRGSGRLVGRKALVTGGDSGIGRAAAIAFAREGADVAINYLPEEQPDAAEVEQVIRAAGRKAVLIPGDIRDEAFCRHLVETANRQLGGLDILVNSAGRQQAIPTLADLTTEEFDRTMKTNLYAMFWITKAAVPLMQPGSAIINVASEQAYNPDPWLKAYAPTKAAIANWTKLLAKDLVKQGIRINAVAPGPVWTPLQISGGTLPGKVSTFGAQTPIGRAGEPVEMAPAFVTLASQESSFTTGQIYGATGGNLGPG